ncbi:MAG: extracellular solute-binding protein [Anaerolineaceae bacterium]|jgi:putative spermidine/putrescine transport system substrate-binding protein
MKSNRLFQLLVLVMIASFALAACSPAATAAPTAAPTQAAAASTAVPAQATTAPTDWSKATSAADGGGMDALVKAAQAEGNLTVITLPRNWCDYGEMMDNFTAKYGIKIQDVNPDGGSADEVQAIKDNEQNAGPQAPDVLDVGAAYGPLASGQSPTGPNLLSAYKVATWDTIKGNNDASGLYYVDYYGVMSFEINTDVVKDVPQTWSDLLKAEYKGEIGLPGDPRASNEAAQSVYAAAINNGGTLDNIQAGLDFMKKLASSGNLLPLIADPGVIAKGETPVSIHWSFNALADKASFNGNPNIKVVYPTGTAWGGYYYQAISAYAPHPAAARLWEEYLYSDEGQTILAKGFCIPARFSDLTSRNVLSQDILNALPATDMFNSAVIPSLDQLNAARAAIKNQWDTSVGLDVKSGS